MIGLTGKIGNIRNRSLHAVCHFILLYLGGNLRVAKFFELQVVKITKLIQQGPSAFAISARGVPQVKHRIRSGHKLHALVNRIQESSSEEHTYELQSLMRISYAVFCLKKKNNTN